jgi:hypothetical protein
MYNYTIIAYGIKIPDDYKEIFEEYLDSDLLINPYNGGGDPESALGIEISDTDFDTDFIDAILSFDKEENDKIYQEKMKDFIQSIKDEKDELIKELQISELDYNSILVFLSTKPELIRLDATS